MTYRASIPWVLAIALALGAGSPATAAVVDEVVASVDKEPILLSEVMTEIGPALQDLRKSSASEADYQQASGKLIRDTVEQAITSKLLLREAQIAGIKVEDSLIERRLEQDRAMYPSNEAFQKAVEASGMTVSEYRERLQKSVMASKLASDKRRQFESDIVVSESDVAQYFNDHRNEFVHPERVRVRQIFLAAPSDPAQRAVVRARLEQVKKELDAGAAFADLAQKYSEAPGAKEGGVIGWVAHGDLVPALDEAVFNLPDGAVSGIIETDTGLSIVKVEQRQAAGEASLDDVRKDIEPLLRQQGASERFTKWLEELRKRGRVQVFL